MSREHLHAINSFNNLVLYGMLKLLVALDAVRQTWYLTYNKAPHVLFAGTHL